MPILRIQRTCRFGNNVYQLYNAILFANQIKAAAIDVSGLSLFNMFRKDFVSYVCFNGVKLINDPKIKDDIITDKFFHPHDFAGYEFKPDRTISKLVFQDIKQAMGISSKIIGKSEDIVCHIRSGDIFLRDRPKHNYTQPPVSFYLKAVEDNLDRHNKVKIVFENKANPCVNGLCQELEKRKIGFICQSGTLTEDILSILEAKTVVSGKGTFIPMIASISGKTEKLIVFRKDVIFNSSFFDYLNVKVETYIDNGNDYIPDREWKICRPPTKEALEQLDMIVSYPLENIVKL
jgi:hypothetical protein